MKEIMTAQEVAELLQVSTQTIRAMTINKQLPSYRIGTLVRYNRIEVMKLFGGTVDTDPILDWLLEQIEYRKGEKK